MTTHPGAPLLTALALFLLACPPPRTGNTGDDDDAANDDDIANDDDSAACASPNGTLRACVYWQEGGDIAGGSLVAVRSNPEDTPIDALTGEDGCVDVTLAAGSWEASGRSSAGDCVTPFEPYELVACEILEIDLYLMEWCMDGR